MDETQWYTIEEPQLCGSPNHPLEGSIISRRNPSESAEILILRGLLEQKNQENARLKALLKAAGIEQDAAKDGSEEEVPDLPNISFTQEACIKLLQENEAMKEDLLAIKRQLGLDVSVSQSTRDSNRLIESLSTSTATQQGPVEEENKRAYKKPFTKKEYHVLLEENKALKEGFAALRQRIKLIQGDSPNGIKPVDSGDMLFSME